MTVPGAALAVLVGLAAAPAQAGADEPVPTNLTVTVGADVPPPTAGGTAWLNTTLFAADGALPDRPVRLEVTPYAGAPYDLDGTTSAEGVLWLGVRELRNFRYRWVFAGDATYAPSSTPTRRQVVSPRVGIRFSTRTPRVGERVVVTGRTHPAKPGNTVRLFRGRTNAGAFGPEVNPVLLDLGRVRADGTYRFVTRFARSGTRRLFVRVSRGGGNTTGWSDVRRLRVG
jgi:hypothetical protein